MTHDRPLAIGLVACALLHACAGQQFTPQQEWVYTKFPECQTRTNAFNVKLDRVEPNGAWHVTVQQTQTDYNLLAACMKAEWAAQQARLQTDDAEALRWYRAGAEAGNFPSMAVLGHMYATGKGVAKDETEAVRWYRKAADAGERHAMFLLGQMYESGKGGLASDRAQAVSWYRKSATAGYEPAARRLGALGEQ